MRPSLVALALLALGACDREPETAPDLHLLGVWQISERHGFIGGLSGLELSEDGERFTMLSDGGFALVGRFHRDAEGFVDGMRQWRLLPLIRPEELQDMARGLDSEGVAVDGEGRIFVSLERIHEVWQVDFESGDLTRLPPVPGSFWDNGSIEALAAAPDGSLYAIPEQTAWLREDFPVYRWAEGGWTQPFLLPRRGLVFLPTGADFGPDGRLYVLERAFWGIGFGTRIRSFALTDTGLTDERLLFRSPLRRLPNLEGIAAWRDTEGRIRLTLVADNNYGRRENNVIVELALDPAGPGG